MRVYPIIAVARRKSLGVAREPCGIARLRILARPRGPHSSTIAVPVVRIEVVGHVSRGTAHLLRPPVPKTPVEADARSTRGVNGRALGACSGVLREWHTAT